MDIEYLQLENNMGKIKKYLKTVCIKKSTKNKCIDI